MSDQKKNPAEILKAQLSKISAEADKWSFILLRFSASKFIEEGKKALVKKEIDILKNIINSSTSGGKGVVPMNNGDMVILLKSASSDELSKLNSDIKNSLNGVIDLEDNKSYITLSLQNDMQKAVEIATHYINLKPEEKKIDVNIDVNQLQKAKESNRHRVKPMVLLVEDNPFTSRLIAETLGSKFDLVAAADGKEAIEKYSEFAPNIVFLDINIPLVNGHQVLAKITSTDPDAFVVMLTASQAREDIASASKNKAQGYIPKPFNKEKIDMFLRKYFDLKKK